LVWQPCLGELRGAELVIVEQASRLLLNYLLLGWRAVGGPRLGLWGHGLNLDTTSRSRWGEAVKRRLVRRADWWFCYTEGTKALVTSFGMPEDRCTVVQNAIDTSALTAMRAAVTEERHAELRAELGVGNGPVLLWLSSIYPTKRPEFALAAMRALRREMPAVELLVVGDGPQRSVFDAATSEGWVHTVGVATGQRMVECASLATLIVNPGLVGLTVLDAFALELPMVTCDLDLHSPEYEYLVPEENSVVLPAGASADEYADALVHLLADPGRLERLREGCRRDREAYTVEEMVHRFAEGIMEALDA
jgi:glycosyltransferase involved in cell wall biosynthesis